MNADSGHAIVFGASGLIGWSVVDQLMRSYPRPGRFSKVTAVTNRPIDVSQSSWPELSPDQPELQLVSDIDLRGSDPSSLAECLKQKVRDIESVTHIYYLVFTAINDDIEEVATNLQMFQNVIGVHNLLSPRLQFVVFPGGTRGYGIYLPGGTFTPPLEEDMVDNLPADYAKTVVYPAYRELLNRASAGKQWTWCEVCPDAIIGFTPNGSQFSLALHWAQYLSLYAYNHGIGPHTEHVESAKVEVPFPGSASGASSLFSPVSAKTIARFMIYASTHPETCGSGQLFNIADNDAPVTYGELWPKLAAWFGLEGVGPADAAPTEPHVLKVGELPRTTQSSPPGEYIDQHRDVFVRHGLEGAANKGVGAGSRQLDSVGYWLTFDRQLSLKKVRGTGFEGNKDPTQGWLETFELFRKAGIIL
ncbi:hypothetical protein BX600DRAFT_383064 [Xylariales sp. PMI_506]|nr:hypothetical protein BX600DRAFT_383064 [Xylariales sp. PMI_506]